MEKVGIDIQSCARVGVTEYTGDGPRVQFFVDQDGSGCVSKIVKREILRQHLGFILRDIRVVDPDQAPELGSRAIDVHLLPPVLNKNKVLRKSVSTKSHPRLPQL